MNKKTLWVISLITGNTLILIGLILITLSFKNDTQTYTEKTNITIEKSYNEKVTQNEEPLDDSDKFNETNIQVKKEITTTNKNDNVNNELNKNKVRKVYKVNDSANNTNTSNNTSNMHGNESNENTNYTCGFCGKIIENATGICEGCKAIRNNFAGDGDKIVENDIENN